MLGTTNRGGPFSPNPDGDAYADVLKRNFEAMQLDGLIVIGGDGTQEIGYRLMTEYGIPVVGVQKPSTTILRRQILRLDFGLPLMWRPKRWTVFIRPLNHTIES